MNINYNREDIEIEEGTTVSVLVKEFKKKSPTGRTSVWINDKMVRMGDYKNTEIHEGDVVVIKKVTGGGLMRFAW